MLPNNSTMRIILLAISIGFSVAFSSCKEYSDLQNENDNNNYYVKYEISGNGTYGRFSNWTVTTPGSLYKNNGNQTRSWSQIYGPVKAGFRCNVNIADYISGAPTIRISVSKNNEPYTVKVSTPGRSAFYIIE